ncbi:major facilitator superfamily domain-containing protein [Mycena capillaripes]|nr:major facilitator superfamily domain-containing protein [Mycena capillaripes]
MTGGFGPLPPAETSALHGGTASAARILGPRWAQLPTLTIGLLGVQILWSVEMSYAPPYLLSLGLTKPAMAMVFLAGPLSGFFVQPLIGVLADNSTSRWGRRRPYMLGGCAICAASMLLLGYTREVAAMFTGYGNPTNEVVTKWLAVLAIYMIDFSVNAVQAVDRALLVDTLPPALQASGNAWAAAMLGLGSLTGFFVGNLDLPALLPFLGSTELQVLSALVVFLILTGHFVTAVLVKESVVRTPDLQRPSFRAEIKQLWTSMWMLPRVIQQIFMVQFFAWLGWFPALLYTTTYISDLYARSAHSAYGHETPGPADSEVVAEGTRLGARALFFSAILALLTNLVLPAFTYSTSSRSNSIKSSVRKIPLATVWAGSHLLFGACMLATFTVSSVQSVMWVIAITGVPWAVTQWAPFALLAEAILTCKPATGWAAADHGADVNSEVDSLLHRVNEEPEPDLKPARSRLDPELTPGSNDVTNLLHRLDLSSSNADTIGERDAVSGLGAQAGVILGIHNVCIVIPQFLMAILCAVVFALFDSDGAVSDSSEPTNKPSSVVYIFRLGALWSFIAFAICRRMARELGE